MAYSNRLPLVHEEVTSNVSVGDDVLLKEIIYNPGATTSNSPEDSDNNVIFSSHLPLKIYSYEWELISSCLIYGYQTYKDRNENITYNPDDDNYLKAVKQEMTVPGTVVTYATQWQTDDEMEGILGDPVTDVTSAATVAQWAVRKVNFQAKRDKKGGWKTPPITLAPNKLDSMQFRFYVRNTNGSNQCDVYSRLKIKSWKQML